MLKKAGIIASVVAAGVLGVSAVAFADVSNSETGNVTNDCASSQEGSQVAQELTGGSSLAGIAGLVTGAVVPADTQTNLGNCTNLNVTDVIDSGSGNVDESATRTEVEDSYNTDFNG